jgi:hypothetical protein
MENGIKEGEGIDQYMDNLPKPGEEKPAEVAGEEVKQTNTEEDVQGKEQQGQLQEEVRTAEGNEKNSTEQGEDGKLEQHWFNVEKFNEWSGRKFEKEDDIKTIFEKVDKIPEYEEKISKIQELEKKNEDFEFYKNEVQKLADAYNPLNAFGGNEKAYKDYTTMQQIGQGKDPGVVQKVVQTDLDKMSDLDVLSLQAQFNAPTLAGQGDAIKKAILEQNNVEMDEDFNINGDINLTASQKINIATQAAQARNTLNTLKNSVEIPKHEDVKQQIEQKLQERKDFIEKSTDFFKTEGKRLSEDFKKLEKDDFVFDVPQEFRDKLPEYVTQYALNNNIEPTKENMEKVANEVKTAFEIQYREQIAKSMIKDALTKQEKEFMDKYENNQEFNKKDPPENKGDGTPDNSELMKEFGF